MILKLTLGCGKTSPVFSFATSCPVFDREWKFVGKPGWHRAIYFGRSGGDRQKAQPQGVEYRFWMVFLWESRSDRANFVRQPFDRYHNAPTG